MRTHYDELEVTRTASDEVIRGAYRHLIQKWHPDKNPDNYDYAANRTNLINQAYAVLSSPDQRGEYDDWLAEHEAQEATANSTPHGRARDDVGDTEAPPQIQDNVASASIFHRIFILTTLILILCAIFLESLFAKYAFAFLPIFAMSIFGMARALGKDSWVWGIFGLIPGLNFILGLILINQINKLFREHGLRGRFFGGAELAKSHTSTTTHTQAHTPNKNEAIWNPNAAANWSLLLSPAFGSYLHASNWRALGDLRKAKAAMVWFYFNIAFLVFYLCIDFLVDKQHEADAIVRAIAFGNLLAWYFASGRPQAVFVKENFGKNYSRRTWGAPLLIGAASFVVYVALAIVVYSTYEEVTTNNVASPSLVEQAAETSAVANSKELQNWQFDKMLDQLEAAYPAVNPNSPDYNRQSVIDLESGVAAYERQDMTGPIALQRAALDVTGVRLTIPEVKQ